MSNRRPGESQEESAGNFELSDNGVTVGGQGKKGDPAAYRSRVLGGRKAQKRG